MLTESQQHQPLVEGRVREFRTEAVRLAIGGKSSLEVGKLLQRQPQMQMAARGTGIRPDRTAKEGECLYRIATLVAEQAEVVERHRIFGRRLEEQPVRGRRLGKVPRSMQGKSALQSRLGRACGNSASLDRCSSNFPHFFGRNVHS